MWTVGVSLSGNGSPFTTPEQLAAAGEATAELAATRGPFDAAGAHYVIPSVVNLPAVLDDIEARISAGEVPVPAADSRH
jgi:phosphonoacetaldehyde hydrolase